MTTSPESLALLGRAAELRAAGTPWADAAMKLAVDPGELRRLASEHARDYDRLMRRARTEVLRETLDAALTALRTLLQSAEPRVSMVAATTIVRYDLARMRYGGNEAGARRSSRRGEEGKTPPGKAKNPRNENVSESPKVPTQQEVNPAKNLAQSRAPDAPATRPSPPPAPAQSATPSAETRKTPDAETIRRKRLFHAAMMGHRGPAAPLTRGGPQTLEVDRLISGWLAEG